MFALRVTIKCRETETIIINSKKGSSVFSGDPLKKEQIDGIAQKKLREIERDEIIHALKECNCVRARAARRLGITERMIGYKIKKYGIRIKEVRWIEER